MKSIKSLAKTIFILGFISSMLSACVSVGSNWVPGHYNRFGVWVPAHYAGAVAGPVVVPGRVWVPGHTGRFGQWIPGHWR